MKKGQDTRERILRTACELFCEHGYVKASTRELAKRLKMANSSIYSHFSSKEEILFAIVQDAGNKVLETLNEVVEEYDEPVECLGQMIFRMVCLLEGMRKQTAVFASELDQLSKHYRKLCTEQHRQIFRLFRGKISELEANNLINPNDGALLTFSILGTMNWVYRWYDDAGPLSMQDIADGIVRLVFMGLLRTEVPAKNWIEGMVKNLRVPQPTEVGLGTAKRQS